MSEIGVLDSIKVSRLLLVGYRANLDEPDPYRLPFDDSPSGAMLDECDPVWRKLRVVNLLNSKTDKRHDDRRAKYFTTLFDPELLVLFGRDTAQAFGLSRSGHGRPTFEWFTVYNRHIFGKQRLVVIVPHPSPRNRMWNDPATADQMRGLFEMIKPGGPWRI